MNLAFLMLQTNEPFDFEGLVGQIVRFGVIALFFAGPLLKKFFEARQAQPKARRRVATPVPSPYTEESEPEELEDAWTVLPQVEPTVPSSNSSDWIDDPRPMGARLLGGDPMHSSFDEHKVPLDLPQEDRRGTQRGWRSAILMREVLGPPVGLRSQNADRAPFG